MTKASIKLISRVHSPLGLLIHTSKNVKDVISACEFLSNRNMKIFRLLAMASASPPCTACNPQRRAVS